MAVTDHPIHIAMIPIDLRSARLAVLTLRVRTLEFLHFGLRPGGAPASRRRWPAFVLHGPGYFAGRFAKEHIDRIQSAFGADLEKLSGIRRPAGFSHTDFTPGKYL